MTITDLNLHSKYSYHYVVQITYVFFIMVKLLWLTNLITITV